MLLIYVALWHHSMLSEVRVLQSIAHPMLLPSAPKSSSTSLTSEDETIVNDQSLSDLTLVPTVSTWEEVVETAAPKLTREEELYALSLIDLVANTAGKDISTIVAGDALTESASLVRVVVGALRNPQILGDSQAAQFVRQLLPTEGSTTAQPNFMDSFAAFGSVNTAGENAETSAVASVSDEFNADLFLEQWTDAVDELDEQEREALTATATRILQRVALRTVNRLEPLTTASASS